jgi:hypothetical protein
MELTPPRAPSARPFRVCPIERGPSAIWGNATLAMAVSSSSMKVASVTVTAMIHGLIPSHVAATFGKENGT